MPEIYVGLGSNVEPNFNLRSAVAGMRAEFGSLAMSSVYRSAPVGFTGDDFLNMVVRFTSSASAQQIHARLSAMEEDRGRARAAVNLEPRTLDLDLLLVGQLIDPALRLPHTDILLYAFVLKPLTELAPDLLHPVTGARLQAVWSARASGTSDLVCMGPLSDLSA
jgi:2-amino-4-hydroxy-6-hydroxymethyldihydropteridine diphosphokinase